MNTGRDSLPPLRVLIAEDETLIAMALRTQLTSLGHEVVAVARTGEKAVELARRLKPDMIFMDIKMPEMDGLEASQRILSSMGPVPILITTAYCDDELSSRAAAVGVMAYLIKPINEDVLEPTMRVALARFHELQTLRTQVTDLGEALETRKVVEKAKGILMERLNLSERDAFRRLQQESSRQSRKMREVAEAIITADEVLHGEFPFQS
jgi:AmiR/NasT family two-component response regulator